ncbi:MAG: hypothetical protein IV095_10625 [Sediminibacterium sp.]|nr:hypothetical protein [Sediminibacterium sp.]
MGGVSSKAANALSGRKKFNGNELQQNEFSDGSGLEFYDFNARTYDQQIGRFIQIDPETEFLQESFSPFHFGINNPILYDDPDGKNPYILYRGLKLIYEVAVWAQKQGNAVPSAMALKNVSDNTVIVKPIMYLNDANVPKTESSLGKAVSKDDDAKTNKTHGNKLDDKPAEGYTLRDKKSGEVKKYGETTRGEDKYGKGGQKRYTKKELKERDVYYQKESSGTKKEMHKWQNEKIKEHKTNNNGKRPRLNKSDY